MGGIYLGGDGRFEVFVRPFANGVAAREKIQISESGGDFPVWRADGQELYFMSEDATIHAVATDALRLDGLCLARRRSSVRVRGARRSPCR